MTRRFCVLCGRTTDELIQNVCVECFTREKSILHLPEKLRGEVCGYCGARKSHGRWIEPGTGGEEAILKAAEEALRESMAIEASDAEVHVEGGVAKKSSDKLFLLPFKVSVKGSLEGVILESKGTSTAEVRVGICDDCTRRKSGYFEAVLQVRGEEGIDRDQMKRISGIVEESLRIRHDKRAFVSKVEERKEGIDYYLGSVKAARRIARVIKEKFGGRVSESPKLVGRKDGKDLYRVSIAVRLPKRRIK